MRFWVEQEEGRPGEKAANSTIHLVGESETSITDSAAHCLLCRHPLTARKSVERGLGPVCARRMIALLIGGGADE